MRIEPRDLGESASLMVWGSGSKQHFPSQSHSAGRKYMTAFPPIQCFWVLSNRPDFHTKAKNYATQTLVAGCCFWSDSFSIVVTLLLVALGPCKEALGLS